jgi:hypothetical protein
MVKKKPSASRRHLEDLLATKSRILTQAQAFTATGMVETAQPVWVTAASYEERIASLLDAHGEALEAAVHRISAASCYRHAGDPSRAINLFRAALAGPLREVTRKEVEAMLAECLALLIGEPPRRGKAPADPGS